MTGSDSWASYWRRQLRRQLAFLSAFVLVLAAALLGPVRVPAWGLGALAGAIVVQVLLALLTWRGARFARGDSLGRPPPARVASSTQPPANPPGAP